MHLETFLVFISFFILWRHGKKIKNLKSELEELKGFRNFSKSEETPSDVKFEYKPEPKPEPTPEPVSELKLEIRPDIQSTMSAAKEEVRSDERINWEQWIGVRGAALLGGIVLALAGLLFFKYSVEHGLLSPFARVLLATITGLSALVISEVIRKKGYINPSNALSGAGIVILYVCTWAASPLYHIISTPFAFVLVALITAACATFSLRYESQFIAVLGVLGGFLTPVRLSTGADHYLGFFTYIFLIDLAFLWIAHKRQWSKLLFVVMGGTFILQALWIFKRMGDRLPIGLAILAAFTLLFAWSYYRQKTETGAEDQSQKTKWNFAHVASLVGPYLFLFYFSQNIQFTHSLFYPFALFILFLTGLSVFISFKQQNSLLANLAAGSSSGILLLWVMKQSYNLPPDAWIRWEVMGVVLLVVGLFTLATFLSSSEDKPKWHPSLLLSYGSALLLSYIIDNFMYLVGHPILIFGIYWMLLLIMGFFVADFFVKPILLIGLPAGIVLNFSGWFFRWKPSSWLLSGVLFLVVLTAKLRSPKKARMLPSALLKPTNLMILGIFIFSLMRFSSVSYPVDVFPWVTLWMGLFSLVLLEKSFYSKAWLGGLYGFLLGLNFKGLFRNVMAVSANNSQDQNFLYLLGTVFGVALLMQAIGLLPVLQKKPISERRSFELSLSLFLSIVLISTFFEPDLSSHLSFPFILGTSLVLGLCAILSATRALRGYWYLAALAIVAAIHGHWAHEQVRMIFLNITPTEKLVAFGIEIAAMLLFAFWPFFKNLLFESPGFWMASALAAPAFFYPIRILFVRLWGRDVIGIVPIGLAFVSLLSAIRTRKLMKEKDDHNISKLVWPLAATLGLISIAIPLQLKNEWVTVGWAIEGFLLLQLWKKLDHAGLKYYALSLLVAVSIRLLLNNEVFHYHERSGFPVVNWLLYSYWVPAAALIGSSLTLSSLEMTRAREWEKSSFLNRWSMGAIFCGASSVLVFFVWINLSIADYFGSSNSLSLDFTHHQAKDLTTSIAWALYAMVLLAVGLKRKNKALRWTSLLMMIVTILKVFLHDLGQLEDLYRVFSLVGLAISLLVVSLVYQRFVFKKGESA